MNTKEDLEIKALVDIVVERVRQAGIDNISDKHMDEIYYVLLGEYQRNGYDKAVHYAKTAMLNPKLLNIKKSVQIINMQG